MQLTDRAAAGLRGTSRPQHLAAAAPRQMAATFSWEREWLREASLHLLGARAMQNLAHGRRAAKQRYCDERAAVKALKTLVRRSSSAGHAQPARGDARRRGGESWRSPANDAQASRGGSSCACRPAPAHASAPRGGLVGSRAARARRRRQRRRRAREHAARPAAVARAPTAFGPASARVALAERLAAAGPAARRRRCAHSPGGGGTRLRADELAALRAVQLDAIAAAGWAPPPRAGDGRRRRRRPRQTRRPAPFALSLSPPSPPPSRPPRKPRSPPKTPAAPSCTSRRSAAGGVPSPRRASPRPTAAATRGCRPARRPRARCSMPRSHEIRGAR